MSLKYRSIVAVLAVLLALTGAAIASAQPTQWDPGADFRVAPNQANPNPDSLGHGATWYFEEGPIASTRDPSAYTLLPNYITGCTGTSAWQSGAPQGGDPVVSFNQTAADIACGGALFPAKTLVVHPTPDRYVIVGWKSPVSGVLNLTGSFADTPPGCGDGVNWFIDRDMTPLAAGGFGDGGSQTFGLSSVPVSMGQSLYFIVGPGPFGSYECDSTALVLQIGVPTASADATVTGDVSSVLTIALERSLVDFGSLTWNQTPTPISERVTVVSNGAGGYALSVHRSAFSLDDLPRAIGSAALSGSGMSLSGLTPGVLATIPITPAADRSIGGNSGPTSAAGDVWPTSLGFSSPIPFVRAGMHTATVTFTVVGS